LRVGGGVSGGGGERGVDNLPWTPTPTLTICLSRSMSMSPVGTAV
jgi:hypothetical protein